MENIENTDDMENDDIDKYPYRVGE